MVTVFPAFTGFGETYEMLGEPLLYEFPYTVTVKVWYAYEPLGPVAVMRIVYVPDCVYT